jgi:hypothetical protein
VEPYLRVADWAKNRFRPLVKKIVLIAHSAFRGVQRSDTLTFGLITKTSAINPGMDRTEVYRRGRKIIVVIDGYHSNDHAWRATQQVAALAKEINGPVEVVGDLSNITGFTAEGRSHWQKVFKEIRRYVTLITMVQGTALARMAVSAVGLYAGIKFRFVDTLDEALREPK